MKQTLIQDRDDADLITELLLRPPGYHVELFSILYVRSLEDSGKIRYAVGHNDDNWEEIFDTATEAARYFLQKRHEYSLGIDYERDVFVYLCGAIAGCSDEECKEWRNYCKSKLHYHTLDPMERDYRNKVPDHVSEIIEFDKKNIDKADIILVNYTKPSVGTSMEILYSWERHKKVILVVPHGVEISPWLTYHSHKIFSLLDDAIQFINNRSNSWT